MELLSVLSFYVIAPLGVLAAICVASDCFADHRK